MVKKKHTQVCNSEGAHARSALHTRRRRVTPPHERGTPLRKRSARRVHTRRVNHISASCHASPPSSLLQSLLRLS
ncbi:MAG: hypothetical protein RL204_497 [Bacteroidota bacterium]|jgi:hypothetical protein